MESDFHMDHLTWTNNSPKGYALTGEIMLCAIVVLFGVIVFTVGLHIYARWYLLRLRRRQLGGRRHRTPLIFYVDNPNNPLITAAVSIINRGLDASVLSSLPVFVYTSKSHQELLECAVCLSDFEENERGRLLPKCNHSFHIDCIDMWLHSHSTCPICRSPVELEVPAQTLQNKGSEVVVPVGATEENEPGSSSRLCASCQHEDNGALTSLGFRKNGLVDRRG